jgi:hypothetical protein
MKPVLAWSAPEVPMLTLETHLTREEWQHQAQALNGRTEISWIREKARQTDAAGQWRPIIDQLDQIKRLQDDWDGLGAKAPESELVKTAAVLFYFWIDNRKPAPTRVVASTAGTIVIEWQGQGEDGSYMEWEIDRLAHAEIMMRLPGKPVEHHEWPTH